MKKDLSVYRVYECEAFGNTFDIRDELKKRGFRFKKESRSWVAFPVLEKDKAEFEILTKMPGVKLRFTQHGRQDEKS